MENDQLILNGSEEDEQRNKIDKTLKIKYIIFICIIFLILAIVILIIIFFSNNKIEEKEELPPKNMTIDFNFNLVNNYSEQDVIVNWDCSHILDLISITVKGINDEKIRIYNIVNTSKGNASIQLYYGNPKINIFYQKDNYTNNTSFEFNIPIKEICIAPLIASLPVALLSFELFNISKTYNCPIYVGLERHKTWNWESLPKNVYLFDYIDKNNYKNKKFNDIYYGISEWIKQLYITNNDIKIHLFLNDYHTHVLSLYIFANNIPEKNYDCTFLSDGTASYLTFNGLFDNNETYIKTYEDMSNKWKNHKKLIWDLKYYKDNIKNSNFINKIEMRKYSYVIVREENNVFWWLTKIKDLFAPNNPAILEELLNNNHILLKDTKHLLSILNETEKIQIKSLFNFDESYFEEAVKQQKLIMVIAGTYDKNEHYFYDYCKSIKKFYGDKYIYYYKGHPVTPTDNYPEKQKKLIEIDITPIDSVIPLEIIFFFNQNIYLSGYYTSSFLEIEKENLKGLFDQIRKEEDYFNKFDLYSKYTVSTDSKYKKYLNNSDGVVLDINKNKLINFEYDFGIYFNNDEIIFYNF